MGKNSARHALIIADVQHGFLTDYTSRCLPRIKSAVKEPIFDLIIATRFYNPPGSAFRNLIKWDKLSTPGEVALHPVVEASAELIIDKTTYGAAAELEEVLTRKNVSTVTLMGIDTDVCVLHNAAILFDLGFKVYVDLRGCATNGGPDADRSAVRLMERTIGRGQVIVDQ